MFIKYKKILARVALLTMTLGILQQSFANVVKASSGGTYVISTVAGNGGTDVSGIGGHATNAGISGVEGVAVDKEENIYLSNFYNCVEKVTTDGAITVVAGIPSFGGGYSGDGMSATSAKLSSPSRLAVDKAGNLYISDAGNKRIRKVTTDGIITTVAGNGQQGRSGDGGPAINAQLGSPVGITIDKDGNLYIADNGNCNVRKVDTNGIITTLAGNGSQGYSGDGGPATSAKLFNPFGVAVDNTGNVYIADKNGNRIRKVTTDGIISTVAGNGASDRLGAEGVATNVKLCFPSSLTIDSAGNLYFPEEDGHRIRKVSTDGIITTIAGNGSYGYSGDGGPATSAMLSQPQGIAVDSAGNVYIADLYNHRIRKLQYCENVTAIEAMQDKNVPLGTALGDVLLPQSVNITLSNNTTTSAAVTWNTGSSVYNANTPGTYTITGTISLPAGVANLDNKQATVNVVVAATAPQSPTNATAIIKNGRATIKFTPPASDEGNPITGYIVTVNPGNYTVSGTGSPIMVTGLKTGTNYTFTLKAVNSSGESASVNVSQ